MIILKIAALLSGFGICALTAAIYVLAMSLERLEERVEKLERREPAE